MFYNALQENLLLPLGDRLLGTAFMPELRQWRAIQKLSPGQVAALQENRLGKLLDHAVQHIPYYQALNRYAGLAPAERLRAFPVMRKSEIRAHLDSLVQGDRRRLVSEKSSGSSGIQGEVFMSRREQFNAIAHQTFLWEWAGYRLGAPMLQLGMTTQRSRLKSLKDRLLRTAYQQAFEMDKSAAGGALDRYRRKQAFFGGYASGLYTYALLAEELGIDDIYFKAAISWGDKMFPHYREKIESVFHTRVFDTYGCTEGMIIAGQCEMGNYHILTPHLYLELLDEQGRDVPPGEPGHVVATRLDAYAMPLIRYYLGDLAIREAPEKTCPCGRPFPLLRQIIGRDTDIVRTRSGKYLIVHFFTGIFEHIPEIRQFRVIQKTLDGIEVEYIPDPALFRPETLEGIGKKIEEKLGEPLAVAFRQVELIPPTPSGKPQIIQSFIVA